MSDPMSLRILQGKRNSSPLKLEFYNLQLHLTDGKHPPPLL